MGLDTQPEAPRARLESPFHALRETVHTEMEEELRERIERGIPATREEAAMGAFREMLEPQVRDAIYELYRKGYSTESSGFGGEEGELQALDGGFSLDEATKAKLKELGVELRTGEEVGRMFGDKRTYLVFKPQAPNLKDITDTWNRIAAILPDLGREAEPSLYGLDFQEQYATEHVDILKRRIERILGEISDDISPERRHALEQKLHALA